jgi:hypothetical protein
MSPVEDNKMSAVKVFISYSHADEEYRSALTTHLSALERNGIIELWQDRSIKPGINWKNEIDQRIEEAEIVILLVSANFIESDYCYEKEMKRALERHSAEEAIVLPVIVRASAWDQTPLATLQALPTDAKPIKKWDDPDEAWIEVFKGVLNAAKKITIAKESKLRRVIATSQAAQSDLKNNNIGPNQQLNVQERGFKASITSYQALQAETDRWRNDMNALSAVLKAIEDMAAQAIRNIR